MATLFDYFLLLACPAWCAAFISLHKGSDYEKAYLEGGGIFFWIIYVFCRFFTPTVFHLKHKSKCLWQNLLYFKQFCKQPYAEKAAVPVWVFCLPTSPGSASRSAYPPMREPSGVDLIGCRSKPGHGSVARLPSDNWLGQATVGSSVIQGLSCNLVHLQTIVWTPERLSSP